MNALFIPEKIIYKQNTLNLKKKTPNFCVAMRQQIETSQKCGKEYVGMFSVHTFPKTLFPWFFQEPSHMLIR